MSVQARPLRAIPLTLTPRGWGLVAVAVAVCGVWAAAQLRDLLALAALAVSALVIAVVSVLLMRVCVRPQAEATADTRTPVVGDTVAVTVSVRHRLPFSQGAVLVWQGAGGAPTTSLVIPRRTEARRTVEWVVRRRGPLTIVAAALAVTDPLGLAMIRIPLRARTELLVLPAPLPAECLPPRFAGRGAGRSADRGSMAELGTGTGRGPSIAAEAGGGLREYRAGDPPRRVHWKQSARQDRLLVNVPEPGAGERLAIALMVDATGYPGPPEDFEHAVSFAATLVGRRLDRGTRGIAVSLRTVRSQGRAPLIEQSAASAAEALRLLARAEPVGDRADAHTGDPAGEPVASRAPAFRPTVIVTGTITPAVVALASLSAAGVIVTTSRAGASSAGASRTGASQTGTAGSRSRATIPSGWEIVPLPPLAAASKPAAATGPVAAPGPVATRRSAAIPRPATAPRSSAEAKPQAAQRPAIPGDRGSRRD